MIQLHEQNRNAFPSVLDARIIKDFREFEAGRIVPDARRPHVILMKERVKAILRKYDDGRHRISENFDIVPRGREQIAQRRQAQEEDTASSQHAEIAQSHGQEEEEEEEGASYQQEEANYRRGEEEVELPQTTKFEEQLARITCVLQEAGYDLHLDFAAMEGEQIAERGEEAVGDAASNTNLESRRQGCVADAIV